MVKKILILIFLVFAGSAQAAEISWMYIQHRIYENGRSFNRLAFGLTDDNGRDQISDANFANVRLSDPRGFFVKLSDYKFSMDEEIYGTYDPMRSQWHFNEEWQVDSWFRANFDEPLIPGVYRLKVSMPDGRTAEYEFNFKGVVALPVITSHSFELHSDPFGSLIWTWDIPDILNQMVLNLQTVVKASIDIYKESKQVGYFFIKLPTHMGYLFIPRNIVQKISAKGDQFGLRVQLETRNSNTRAYSDTLIIRDLKAMSPRLRLNSNPTK